MIRDMLMRREMISVNISTSEKYSEPDLKTFCQSCEEAGGNTQQYVVQTHLMSPLRKDETAIIASPTHLQISEQEKGSKW